MKRQTLIIGVLFMFLIFNIVQAQPPQERPGPPAPDSSRVIKMVDELAAAIKLTKEQKEKVLALQFTFFDEMKKQREKNMGDREAMREAMGKLREKHEEQVNALLTEQQKKDYAKYREEQRKRRRERREGSERGNRW
ncbi:hypothetical protein JXJ21_15925 [candidate division KSB1 bacterium]|nr:hypothetical protein [candidate division KSB1 bacterium]